jgi:hypothetical protein
MPGQVWTHCPAAPVIPAKAGIHTEYALKHSMDSRFRENDGRGGLPQVA